MRRWLIAILLILALAALAFFALAPGMIERGMNQIDGKPLPQVSARAQALHKTLTIVDLHSDTLLWKRNILDRAERGHMDLPRLEEGNVARSEEHTSELQSLMRTSYAVFCLKKKKH